MSVRLLRNQRFTGNGLKMSEEVLLRFKRVIKELGLAHTDFSQIHFNIKKKRRWVDVPSNFWSIDYADHRNYLTRSMEVSRRRGGKYLVTLTWDNREQEVTYVLDNERDIKGLSRYVGLTRKSNIELYNGQHWFNYND